MPAGWSCPHIEDERCSMRGYQECQPGYPGCVLHGKMLFADPDHPSNKAYRERQRIQRESSGGKSAQ